MITIIIGNSDILNFKLLANMKHPKTAIFYGYTIRRAVMNYQIFISQDSCMNAELKSRGHNR